MVSNLFLIRFLFLGFDCLGVFGWVCLRVCGVRFGMSYLFVMGWVGCHVVEEQRFCVFILCVCGGSLDCVCVVTR